MALYGLRLIEAVRHGGRWRPGARKRPRYVAMGVAGMMFETDRVLAKVLKKGAGAPLEGAGVLLTPSELKALFSAAPTSNARLAKWASRLEPRRRFYLSAREE